MKYVLFIFDTCIIVIIYLILINYDLKISIAYIKNASKFQRFFFDFSRIASSSVLIVINGFHLQGGGIIQLSLSFLCTSILSGCALLGIFRITKYLSKLEVVVLSYLLSFIFSGFSTLALLSINESTRSIIISGLLIIVGYFRL